MHKQACECEEVSSLPVIGPPHAEVISCDSKTVHQTYKLHELKTPSVEKNKKWLWKQPPEETDNFSLNLPLWCVEITD